MISGVGMYLMPMETVLIQRPNLVAAYVDGYNTPLTFIEFEITCNIQPVFGIGGRNDLGTNIIQDVNSDRYNQGIIIHSSVQLFDKDFIVRTLDGHKYEVLHAENWTPYPFDSPCPYPGMNAVNYRNVAQLCEDDI